MNYKETTWEADGNVGLCCQAEELVALLQEKGWKIATAESCTGGRLADAIVSVAGASSVFDGGVVSYANAVKEKTLGVSEKTLREQGAVSAQCAAEMAQGVRTLMEADLGVATTGIAGPGGGSAEKPVGLVFVAVATQESTTVYRLMLKGDRDAVRSGAVQIALAGAKMHI